MGDVALAPFLVRGRSQKLRRMPHFFLQTLVAVERLVTLGVGFVVTDETVELRDRVGRLKMHVVEPVDETPFDVLDARRIAVNDDRLDAAGEVLGKIPAGKLEFFCELGSLPLRA